MSIGRLASRLARVTLGVAAAAMTSLVLLGQFGRVHPLLDQLNALLSLLVPLLALALAFAVRSRDRMIAAVALLGLTVGFWQLGAAALENFGPRSEAGRHPLVFMTLSTYHANPDPAAIRSAIAQEAPDIVVMQETNGNAAAVVDALLPHFYRVKSCNRPYCSLTILSRWPMRQVKLRKPKVARARPDLVIGEVAAPSGRFRVVNVHLPRPYQNNAATLRDDLAQLARNSQALPLIVAGDFNTATGSFGLSRFAARARLLRRDGFIPTYPADRAFPAVAGIDHVFADARWSSAGCHRTAASRSDHYGVACRLSLGHRN